MKWMLLAAWALVVLWATWGVVLVVYRGDSGPSLVEKINTACPKGYVPDGWSTASEFEGIKGVISVRCIGPRDEEGFIRTKTVAVER